MMARLWRRDAGPLLVAFLLLDLAIFVYSQTAGARLNSGPDLAAQQIAWTTLDVFLVWRVWHRGWWAWAILFALNIFLLAAMLVGWSSGRYVIGLVVFVAAQTLILLAPAVRHRVSRGQQSSKV
jgi:hypothetical protein